MGDGDGQREMVLAELAETRVALGRLVVGRLRIEVQYAEGFVPPLHRHADDLADAKLEDAFSAEETFVARGVRDQDPDMFLHDMIDDGARKREFFLPIFFLAPAQGFRLQLAGFLIVQEDAATVRLDGAEDQFQNAPEQLIEVEDHADGLARLVHDGEVGQGAAQPGRVLLRLHEDAAAFASADRADDRRGQLHIGARDKVDLVRQRFGFDHGLAGTGAENQHGLPDGDMIARPQFEIADFLVVDEDAVDAADIDQAKAVVDAADLRMPA